MPRELVLGNGNMLVNFDRKLSMRDFYYPHVGWENHIGGHRNRFGIWVEGSFSWVDDGGWQIRLGYFEDTLITKIFARNAQLGVELEINDAVHFRHNIYLKKVLVRNTMAMPREVRLFFNQDFSIYGTEVGDTALFDPSIHCIYHYKRNRYFLINGKADGHGIYQFATGTKRFLGAEGTWRDAEDGILEGNLIAQGSVDSTISFRVSLAPAASMDVYYWIVVGKNFDEVRSDNSYVLENTPQKLFRKIGDYWRTWVNKDREDFGGLDQKLIKLYKQSLLIVRTQIDNHGGILAANDSDILKEARDHYSYVWPRDGALVAMALDDAGYSEVSQKFYKFCHHVLTSGGYLLHKYNPDGSVGSSWHPWLSNGTEQLPIQEDETALVLIALWNFYRHHQDLEFIDTIYKPLIRKSANFLVEYRDKNTGLPLPSYDLWEERRGIFTYTAAAVFGGLTAAAAFADLFGDSYLVDNYLGAAEEVKSGILRYLFNKESGRFLRGLYCDAQGKLQQDFTLESSLFAVWAFGVLAADDSRVVNTMQDIAKGLWVGSKIGGIARYTNDYYFRVSDDVENVPGNPWIICTLWLAQWYIAAAKNLEELGRAENILKWVEDKKLESGVLPEQINPYDGSPLSVAPLTWSHATYIATVNAYRKSYLRLKKI